MKQLCTSYTFDPATKQIDFTDLSAPIALEQVLVIFNVTDNVSLYNFADSANAGASVTGNVLTLPAGVDTSAMSATDHLLIYLDIQDYKDIIPAPVIIDDTQPFRVSGQTADGMVRPMKVGADGGVQLSDSTTPLLFQVAAASGSISDKSFETIGYNCFIVQPIGGTFGTGGIKNQQSNDGVTWYDVAGWNTPSSASVNNMYGAALCAFPCIGRYSRFGNTAATTTAISLSVYLRSEQMPAIWAGIIRGYCSQGQSTNLSNPVDVAGWDGSAIRRLMTDSTGNSSVVGSTMAGAVANNRPVFVGGLDTQSKVRTLLTDPAGILQVNATLPQGDKATPSIVELLLLILNELRVNNLMMHELPQVLNAGQPMKAEALLSDDPNTQLIS